MQRRPEIRPAGRISLDAFRVQALLLLCAAVIAPALIVYYPNDGLALRYPPVFNGACGATVAVLLGLAFRRRVTAFPGNGAFAFVIPSFASSYGLVLGVFLAVRLEYSRAYFGTSFVLSMLVAFVISYWLRRHTARNFHVVPFGNIEFIEELPGYNWVLMEEPAVPADSRAVIVADLRYDHAPEWERMLADAAVAGREVYHTKQIRESLTGRVSIEHLSENSFGSLVPNLAYVKVKRGVEVLAVLVLLPVMLVPMLLIAIAIRFDSKGPALFLQERVGHRGRTFRMIKFRSMAVRPPAAEDDAARHDAMTQSDDQRVTRIGRSLRLSRFDELPQLFNVLKGDMSLIGPRPEAVSLSNWYEAEIPFYSYRHIVRPGITGWAQVNQGHVFDLSEVNRKLNYDFYYIKNFSAWLDVLIAFRTVGVILSRTGAR